MKQILNIAILIVILLCSSCQSDEVSMLYEQQTETSRRSNTLRNEANYNDFQYIKEFAKYINIAIQNKDFTSLLCDEAESKIDGDYDILFANSFNSITRGGKNLRDVFIESTNLLRKEGSCDIETFIDCAQENCPLLNMYFPQDFDKDSILNSDEFLIVMLDPTFSDSNSKDSTVLAYNKKGDIINIPVDEEPSVPYIVIGINERFELQPVQTSKLNFAPALTTKFHNYYLPDCYKQSKNKFESAILASCQRDNKDADDIITRARFTSSEAIKDVEKWFRGAPEVHLTVVYADKTAPLDYIIGQLIHSISVPMGENNWYTGSRRKKKPCDNFGNWHTIRWNVAAQKTYMTYKFAEKDNGFKIKVNSLISLSIEGGDDIGQTQVAYTDELGRLYVCSNRFEFNLH